MSGAWILLKDVKGQDPQTKGCKGIRYEMVPMGVRDTNVKTVIHGTSRRRPWKGRTVRVHSRRVDVHQLYTDS